MRRSAAPSVRAIKKAKLQHSSPENSTEKDKFQASTNVANNDTLLNHSPIRDGNEDTKVPRPLGPNTCMNRRPAVLFKPPILSKAQTGHDSKENHTGKAGDKENTYSYYSVVWGKMSKKKHKKWEGDGILVTKGRTAVLKDLEGKEMSKSTGYKTSELEALQEGQTLCIGGKEMEIMGHISSKDYLSGACFHQTAVSSTPNGHVSVQSKGVLKPFGVPNKGKAGASSSARTDTTDLKTTVITPRYNVNAPDALVLTRPSASHQWEHNKAGRLVVDVVMDPHIGRRLRPHQRKGIMFLYECVMGMRGYHGNGAILADDMGLGKTLQCIALIWTLHKQGMYGGQSVVKRTIVITPGSLVKNWCAEFRKWLGNERMKVFAVNSNKRVEEFSRSPVYPVMVVSYEMLLRCLDDVKKIKFDLIICDEAHRLKNKSIKTSTVIAGLKAQRRVLLTGTPIQNDLQEFHALVDLCNPGVLGTPVSFRRIYEEPIVRGQQPDASSEENVLGQTRAAELNRLTSLFFLRRTAEINSRYLPPKVESVVFCVPSALQLSLYRHLLSSTLLRSCLSSHVGAARHLMCISTLKKLCNDPSLIHSASREVNEIEQELDMNKYSLYEGLYGLYPDSYDPGRFTTEHSGKLLVLSRMLSYIRASAERAVLVSNYTQTLDLLQKLCEASEYRYLRLDGSTPTTKRQSLVDRFNSTHCKDFVFLLSSKAGGVGLNLIGASRLILYDIDWNPANDIQAMARVWRDGQKKDVYIYRLLTTGTIEEKIYQRQTAKQGLSGAVADAKDNMKAEFSREDLKDLFTLHELSMCVTHDLLHCPCSTQQNAVHEDSDGESVAPTDQARPCLSGGAQKNLSIAELMEWQHFPSPVSESGLEDATIKSAGTSVSFVFRSESNPSEN